MRAPDEYVFDRSLFPLTLNMNESASVMDEQILERLPLPVQRAIARVVAGCLSDLNEETDPDAEGVHLVGGCDGCKPAGPE